MNFLDRMPTEIVEKIFQHVDTRTVRLINKRICSIFSPPNLIFKRKMLGYARQKFEQIDRSILFKTGQQGQLDNIQPFRKIILHNWQLKFSEPYTNYFLDVVFLRNFSFEPKSKSFLISFRGIEQWPRFFVNHLLIFEQEWPADCSDFWFFFQIFKTKQLTLFELNNSGHNYYQIYSVISFWVLNNEQLPDKTLNIFFLPYPDDLVPSSFFQIPTIYLSNLLSPTVDEEDGGKLKPLRMFQFSSEMLDLLPKYGVFFCLFVGSSCWRGGWQVSRFQFDFYDKLDQIYKQQTGRIFFCLNNEYLKRDFYFPRTFYFLYLNKNKLELFQGKSLDRTQQVYLSEWNWIFEEQKFFQLSSYFVYNEITSRSDFWWA